MNLAERIRKAALGPTPRDSQWLHGWVGIHTAEHKALIEHIGFKTPGVTAFTNRGINENVRRMFLLFVAEAIGESGEAPKERE